MDIFCRPNVFLEIVSNISQIENLEWLASEIHEKREKTEKTIIYCQNINSAVNMYEYFGAKKRLVPYVNVYHAHTSQTLRDNILNDLKRENSEIRVLIATVAFGLGINIPDIVRIIHWGNPGSIQEYWQEVGRCARSIQSGRALMYRTSGSINKAKTTLDMINLVQGEACIRLSVLNYFKFESMSENSIQNVVGGEKCCSRCQINV